MKIVVFPRPDEDGMPRRGLHPRRFRPLPNRRRSPEEWAEVFRPLTALFSLPLCDFDDEAADLPDDFWPAFDAWWEGACEPLPSDDRRAA